MSARLRAGLIGLGAMGRNHARVLSILSGVDLVGIVDPAAGTVAGPNGIPILRSIEQLIDLGIDYAVVACPTSSHLDVGLQLAAEDIHALVEKPLAESSSGARQLAETFAARGLVGAVGHVERYNPALQNARKRLAEGELGELYQVATRRQGPFPGRIADVGVVKDLATHDIDLTAWVTQRAYRSVSAQTAHRSGRPHEDLVAFVGSLDGKVVSNHLVNWLSPLKERVTVITGARGAFVVDTLSADITFYGNGQIQSEWSELAQFRGVSEGDMIRYAITKPEPLRTEHEQFRDALLGRDADIVTMEQGLRTVLVAEAVLESAESQRQITLVREQSGDRSTKTPKLPMGDQ